MNLSTFLDPDAVPFVLPHVSCNGGEVYFGGRFLASVTAAEAKFLSVCDGTRTLAEAAQFARVDARFVARIGPWLLWWHSALGEAPSQAVPVDRIVLTGRPENAWLSIGGRILQESPRMNTLVVTCFGSSGGVGCAPGYPDCTENAFALRDEAAVAARVGRVTQEVWEFPDRALRNHLPIGPDACRSTISEALRAAFRAVLAHHEPAAIFVPAAMGDDEDHRLLFTTALELFADGSFTGELHVYEDVPVVSGYRYIDEFLSRFENSYFDFREYYVDITESAAAKSSLVDVFRFRCDPENVRRWVKSAERNSTLAGMAGSRSAERFWKLNVGVPG
jgi:hypothetical protein